MAAMLPQPPQDISQSNAGMIAEMPDGEIYWIVTKGKKTMPPFEKKLSEAERWGLVHLVRSLSQTPSHSTPRKHSH